MFCFQCEQTAKGTGCTIGGVCGKSPDIAGRQDALTCALIGLARASGGKSPGRGTDELVMKSLFTTVTNVCFDGSQIDALIARVEAEKQRLGGADDFPAAELWAGDTDVRSLRTMLLLGMRGMSAYAWHAHILDRYDPEVSAWFYKGLKAFGEEHDLNGWLGLIHEFGLINLKCMELLDGAHTDIFGHPVPVTVTKKIEKGPFIIITGHDMHDLQALLEQTEGKGINIYTHGEMLPAHGYPELKKYAHLKGNFGTAWQNQQKEFDGVPAPILYTTNCLMLPRKSYLDRVFTTDAVGYPDTMHIEEKDGKKDFSPLIEKALELGGYEKETVFEGVNGGTEMQTGFARHTVMAVADKIIGAVKSGDLKHIFLVGGCDGAKPGRNYYTEFVQLTPPDTVILTLACGKYRFNDLDLGKLGELPRLLDMGQCNDAYSAIFVAKALAEAFGVSINQLPLSLVLSWYEQKAVCVLLTLLSLGLKNIHLGPTLPAFVSPNVLDVLVREYGIKLISTPQQDLQEMLKN